MNMTVPFSDTGEFVVAGALVTVAQDEPRHQRSRPTAPTDPKAIPGATVEYCITVANDTGAATATDVDVVDDLPFDVSYDNSFGIFLSMVMQSCANGVAGGNFSAENRAELRRSGVWETSPTSTRARPGRSIFRVNDSTRSTAEN